MVTTAQNLACYNAAKNLQSGESIANAASKVHAETDMNRTNAGYGIDGARRMMDGKDYKVDLTLEQVSLYLKLIGQDFGPERGTIAADVVIRNVEYTRKARNPKRQIQAEEVANQFRALYERQIQPVSTFASIEIEREKDVERSRFLTAAERQARSDTYPDQPKTVIRTVTDFLRNPHVIADVLLRANGTCEGCHRPAPFLRTSNGTPFLEVHHRLPLAQGGHDTVANAIALCPNCHRQAHFGPLN